MLRKLPHEMRDVKTVVSVALLAVVLVLWVRSHGHFGHNIDEVELSEEPHRFLMSARGDVIYRAVSPGGVSGNPAGFDGWGVLGFGSYRLHYTRGSHYSLSVPYWFLALAAAARPAWRLSRWRRRRKRQSDSAAGLCPACGYDLRASPGRCPECGTAPTAW